jgi:phosphate:Na+ symporter
MSRHLAFVVLCLLLGYGLWNSPDFKEIAAGVAIFLFGMLALEQGFKTFTGGTLERILQFSTDRLWKSVLFGMVTTTLMQSSSLVSVISISFLSAGLLGLAQGIGIIFGANLGSTTGAWLVAGFGLKVDIAAYALPMLVFGVIFQFTRSAALKGGGQILLGLGFLFLGIAWMKEGFEAFGQSLNMADYAMSGVRGLLLFTCFGILATVVMQSSHATLVLTIAALATGQVTYENALALAIGANVGTTITALLGSLGANEPGRRLAAAHLIFNVTTGLVALLFMSVFVEAVDIAAVWLGIAADDWTLKLALFHTLFNLAGLAILLPLTGRLVRWLERLIPQKTVPGGRAQGAAASLRQRFRRDGAGIACRSGAPATWRGPAPAGPSAGARTRHRYRRLLPAPRQAALRGNSRLPRPAACTGIAKCSGFRPARSRPAHDRSAEGSQAHAEEPRALSGRRHAAST